jgi:hypothetical protein
LEINTKTIPNKAKHLVCYQSTGVSMRGTKSERKAYPVYLFLELLDRGVLER